MNAEDTEGLEGRLREIEARAVEGAKQQYADNLAVQIVSVDVPWLIAELRASRAALGEAALAFHAIHSVPAFSFETCESSDCVRWRESVPRAGLASAQPATQDGSAEEATP